MKSPSRYTLILTGTVESQSPISIVPPSWSKKTPDRTPMMIPKMPRLVEGRYIDVPYIPATTLRGRIRRCARDVVRDAVIAKTGNPKPFDLDTAYFLTLGGIKDKGSEDKRTVALEQQWRNQNPLLSLFGSGAPFVEGRASIGNAVPAIAVPIMAVDGVRSDDFRRSPNEIRFLNDADVSELIRRQTGNQTRSAVNADLKTLKRSLKNTTGDEREALVAKIAATEAELDAQEKSTGAVSVGMPLSGYEAIPPNVQMQHRMRLTNVTLEEIGLFLAALNRFALHPIVGAHASVGGGEISAQWSVEQVESTGRKKLGTLSLYPFEPLSIDATDNVLMQASTAWADAAKTDKYDFSAIKSEKDSDE